jgi:hypothetical protein
MSAIKGFFNNYPNKIFIETGTGNGDGIDMALFAGFESIFSIELSPVLFKRQTERFKFNEKVKIIFGDSRYMLWDIIKDIDCPITFWLDAHDSGGETVGEPLPPLIEELRVIAQHPLKNHTIMIDDTLGFNMNDALIKEIMKINDYKISMEDGTSVRDILTATL